MRFWIRNFALLILLFAAAQAGADELRKWRPHYFPTLGQRLLSGGALLSSPVLMVSDGNGALAGAELLTWSSVGGWAKLQEGKSPNHFMEALVVGVAAPMAAVDVGYPYWSLLKGQADLDQGRQARAWVASGLLTLSLLAFFNLDRLSFEGDTGLPSRIKVAPLHGSVPGLNVRVTF